MHKLIDFLCDELEDLERKAEKEGKLSMAEIQYLDTLAHAKKNLMKADEMSDEGYSQRGYSMGENSYRDGHSYARGRGRNARRDSMGRYSNRMYPVDYSMAADDMVSELRDMMHDAPDEQTKREFQKFISKIESM
jgi:hypothetical protein